MRNVREALRLMLALQLSNRQAGATVGISHNTASRYRRLVLEKGLDWDAVDVLSDDALKAILYPLHFQPAGRRIDPDWGNVHKEMRRKGVTLLLLWHEYKENHPDGMSYQGFTRAYSGYRKMLGLVMRQEHKAGDKVFVDYSGQCVEIIDASTGVVSMAQIFVGVLGASNFTYAEATATQKLPDWIGSHIRMFNYFGALPRILVPDNLRSAVSKACEFDPVINPTYQEMARHYNVAVVPARKYRPKDKAKVEGGVKLAQIWILACLRHRIFHSLAELNAAIWALLEKLNNKPFKRLEGCRRSHFEDIDKPAMRPLPPVPFEMAEWRISLRVGLDYHVMIEQHAYSVPYRLARDKVDARLTPTVVELFHNNRRVATHERKHQPGGQTTVHSHMPSAHQHYADQSPERFLEWAIRIGNSTHEVIRRQLESRSHPEAGFRSCMGLQRLARSYGEDRLEASCHRALMIKSPSYTSIKSILKNNLDRQAIAVRGDLALPVAHSNVRGEAFYQGDIPS